MSRTIHPTIRVLNKTTVRKSDLAKIVNVFNYGNVTNISFDDKSVTYGHIYGVSEIVSVSFIRNYNSCVNTLRAERHNHKKTALG